MTELNPGSNTPSPIRRIEGNEQKELDRDFFDLQVQFAKRLSQVTGKPFFEILLTHTILYNRFGLGKVADSSNPVWLEFISGGEEGITDRAYQLYLKPKDAAPKKLSFGCFRHDYRPEEKAVYIHFSNKEKSESPFANPEKRKQELKEMFEYIKKTFPEAKFVRGHSWLYNEEKYKKLFPPEYTANLELDHNFSNGFSTWGQFLDRRSKTKSEEARFFTENLDSAKSEQEVLDAFPKKVFNAQTSIEDFYKYLGVD